ncbi:MAG TPA: hypothetical protein VHE56_09405 [Mycobacteriales bacterium]|nr:hypothetical protein [Mycobacteriales bacterium]
MSARESLIGAGLAVVLVVGIIDAAAGHDSSSKSSPAAGPSITAVPNPPTESPTPSPSSTTSAPKPHHSHHGGSAGSGGTGAVTSTEPGAATSATASSEGGNENSASSPPASTQAVPPGVLGTFTYATTGSEGTNIPGTQRDFPKTTTIKNKLQGCGVSSTWKPIPEHVQKQLLCPASDGIKIRRYQTTISFYGVSSGEDFKCSGPSYIDRKSVAPGDTWKFKCTSPDATAVQRAEVIGFEKVDVGGTSVRTLHVHVDTKLKGQDSGTSSQDYWIDTQKPILVKETGKVTATQQSVHYSSSYSLALKSLSPKT